MKITKHTICDTISSGATVPTCKEAYEKLEEIYDKIMALDGYESLLVNKRDIDYLYSKRGYRVFVLVTAYKTQK